MQIYICFVLALLTTVSQGVVQIPLGNVVSTRDEDAIAGSSQGYTQGDINVDERFNLAKSVQGIANAGSRITFPEGSTLSDGEFNSSTTTKLNTATSNQASAISGSQIVLEDIDNSIVSVDGLHLLNRASDVGVESSIEVDAISGAQFVAGSISNSDVTLSESAKTNLASNDQNGLAVAGVDQAVGNVVNSIFLQDNLAIDNFAVAGDGRAVAGVQSAAKDVLNSTVVGIATSVYNQAKAVNGTAIAGIQNNFGSLRGSFPGGSSNVVLDNTAAYNLATAEDSEAIAGISTNVKDLNRAALIQAGDAFHNKAVTSGKGDDPKNAVAGVGVMIDDVVQSSVVVNVSSEGNQAFNYHQDPNNASNAIAGLEVVVGSADRTAFAILADSKENYALAKHGDAIAGNKVDILNTTSDVIVSLKLNAANNTAVADNGDAIIDNDVTVGGYAKVIGN